MKSLEVIDLKKHPEKRVQAFQMLWTAIPQYRPILAGLHKNFSESSINLACKDNELVPGVALGGHISSETTYWNFFFVQPEYRQSGLGQILLDAFESQVKQADRKRIEMEVYDPKIARWFEKRGYVERYSRTNYPLLLKNESEITMFKEF